MTHLGRTILASIIIMAVVTSMYFLACEDDTVAPPSQVGSMLSIASSSSSSSSAGKPQLDTEVSGVDLAVEMFVLPSKITQVARGYLGGGMYTGFQGRVTNYGLENSGQFKVEIRFADYSLPMGDWSNEKVFATIEAPELGLSQYDSIYLPGNSKEPMYYNAFDIPNEKYKARAIVLNMDGTNYDDLNNSNNEATAQKAVLDDDTQYFDLQGAGETEICIMVDGEADTAMFLFDEDIAINSHRNDLVYYATDELDYLIDYDDDYEVYYYDSSTQPSPYFVGDVTLRNYIYHTEKYLIAYVDDNYKNYTTTNPVICKFLPNGTYYLRVQGSPKGHTKGGYKISMKANGTESPFPNGWAESATPVQQLGTDVGGLVSGGSNAYPLAIGDIYEVSPLGYSDTDASEEEMWFRISLNRDQYEFDDTWDEATEIDINNEDRPYQLHNFHDSEDVDYIYFTVSQEDVLDESTFGIQVYDVYSGIEPDVKIYYSDDLVNHIASLYPPVVPDPDNGDDVNLSITCGPGEDLEAPENVYIRVSNADGSGSYLEHDYKIKVIKLEKPVPISPTDEDVLCTRNPMFRWNSIEGADYFRTQWTITTSGPDTPDFTALELNTTGTGTTPSFTRHSTYEMDVSEYWWRVRAETHDGFFSLWSDELKVTQNMPKRPELNSPANEATNIDYESIITFTWNDVSDEDKYDLILCDNANFSFSGVCFEVNDLNADDVDTDLSADSLQGDTTYYWRVRSKTDGAEGCTQYWTSAYSFTTKP